jgi:TorA maturation chaperone TorD
MTENNLQAAGAGACVAEGVTSAPAAGAAAGASVGAGAGSSAGASALNAADFAYFADVTNQRAAMYGLLIRLFRKEIDATLLAELKAMHYPVESGNEHSDRGNYMIAKYMSNIWENSLTELAVDYVRCFVGHGNDAYAAAYPFESVYRSTKRLLMQGARDEVLAIYRAAGHERSANWNEGDDHISVELEYMQVLCARTAAAFEAHDEPAALKCMQAQLNFFNDHLALWVPMFLKDLKRLAKTGLYQGLAHLTQGFLSQDHQFLKESLA